MKKILLSLILFYQKTVSPDHGVFSVTRSFVGCKFYPSCSKYTYECIEKYGLIAGVWGGLKRIARCHPWSDGGYDPVVRKKHA